jgi:hypothetical protein
MTDFRIDCVNKPDRESRHESITHVGGPRPEGTGRWKDTTADVVKFIEAKERGYYTQEGGAKASVRVRTSATGHKYLQTYADGVWKDNLLALRECS